MLDRIRRQSRSVVVWLLFGVLIAVFVIGFGTPGSDKLSCGTTTKIGFVDGYDLSQEDFKYATRFMMREGSRAIEKAYVLDLMLRREILAQAALRMGFKTAVKADDAADDPDVVKMLTKRRLIVLGFERDLYGVGGWPGIRNSKGKYEPAKSFNYDHFSKWSLWRFGLTVQQFMAQQQRELLASQMAETIQAGVQVSEAEAKSVFELQNHSASLQFARFEVEKYKTGRPPTKAEIDAFLQDEKNSKKVKTMYDLEYKDRKDIPDERRIRHIMVKVASSAPAADKAKAKQRIAAFRQKLVQKLVPGRFAATAESVSEDTDTAKKGGLLGWQSSKDLTFGKAFADAAFKLKDGEISQPIESEKGYHLVLVEGRRKGTWPFDEAKAFLAEGLVVEAKTEQRARDAASRSLDQLKSGKTMDQVFAKNEKPEEGSKDPADKETDKGKKASKEGKSRVGKARADRAGADKARAGGRARQRGAARTGRNAPPGRRGASGGPGRKTVAGAGSGAGSGAGGSGAGSSAGKALSSAPEPALPEVQEATISRVDTRIAGLEERMDAAEKIWSLTMEKPLLHELIELRRGGKLVALAIVRLKSITVPDMKEFESQKNTLMDQYLKAKQQDTLNRWVRHKCEELVKKDRIRIGKQYTQIVEYPKTKGGEAPKPVTINYEYCKLMPRSSTEPFWQ